jgi:hypothetical protein
MTSKIVVYNPETGKAMYTYEHPWHEDTETMLNAMGLSYLVGDTDISIDRLYCDPDEGFSAAEEFVVTVNKTVIQNDGVDQFVVTNVPPGTEVFVDSVSVGTFDDIFSFVSLEEGSYHVKFRKPRYADLDLLVQVL